VRITGLATRVREMMDRTNLKQVQQNLGFKLNPVFASLDNISREYGSLDFNYVKFDKNLKFRRSIFLHLQGGE
jgi:hypothetical protein